MADSDIPAEAVKAAALGIHNLCGDPQFEFDELIEDGREIWRQMARDILAAALPHIRGRVLAEVDAALLTDVTHYHPCNSRLCAVTGARLRDVLGAGGEREETDAEYFQAREDAEMDEHWAQLEREEGS